MDAADLDLWLAEAGNFNVGAAYRYGDATLDGVVDVSDFNVWNDHRFVQVLAGAPATSRLMVGWM